jgi:pyruvate kinase
MIEKAISTAKNAGLVSYGDSVVITAGVPIGVPGKTNMIKADVIK